MLDTAGQQLSCASPVQRSQSARKPVGISDKFTAAVLLNAPLVPLAVYLWPERYPIISETSIVILPFAVIGNTLIIIAPHLWIYDAALAVLVMLAHTAVVTYRHEQQDGHRGQGLPMPDPILWKPASFSDSGGDHQ